jgi:hypothetical protein
MKAHQSPYPLSSRKAGLTPDFSDWLTANRPASRFSVRYFEDASMRLNLSASAVPLVGPVALRMDSGFERVGSTL